jgi:hypothetical protein
MANKEIYCFFRNDDVRGTLDKSLIEITKLFIKNEISIAHAVEPGNISSEVIKWLLDIKNKYPNLIEIMQHGFDHSVKNKIRKGEFGGQRTYEGQFEDIRKGKNLMDKYFGDLWYPAFCFPNGSYNFEAMKAVADNGFKVVNGGWEIDLKHKLFYFVGHLMSKELLFRYKVPYNLEYRPKNKIFQINMNISVIDKYLDEETASIMLSLAKLKTETKRFIAKKTIGILLHHRYHNTEQKIKLIDDYLKWLKTQPSIQFTTIEKIYTKYAQ